MLVRGCGGRNESRGRYGEVMLGQESLQFEFMAITKRRSIAREDPALERIGTLATVRPERAPLTRARPTRILYR